VLVTTRRFMENVEATIRALLLHRGM